MSTTNSSTAARTRSWVALGLLPFAFIAGFALAHIAYLIWPQYEEGAGGEPWWFMIIALLFSYVVIAPVLVVGIRSAWVAIHGGLRSAWLPLIVFTVFVIWQLVIVVAGFLGVA